LLKSSHNLQFGKIAIIESVCCLSEL